MQINGKYNTAKVMIDNIEPECVSQIINLCNQESFKDAKIRIMPDTHSGKGCVVGFTAKMKGKIIPNLVGVDISCSISTYKLDCKQIDFQKLDNIIREKIPSGMNIRKTTFRDLSKEFREEVEMVSREIKDLRSYQYFLNSLGSLGGGNHFIEVNKDKDNNFWLTVHCGSRNFGKRICEFHQNKAIENCITKLDISKIEPHLRQDYIEKNKTKQIPEELRYLEGEDFDLYVKHMKVAQKYATKNHEIIVKEITNAMGWNILDSIFTNHNYIEFLGNREFIVRKGSISAKEGERVIIPINMRDGSIIGVGKGNPEWNYSAPHGAGRVLSRGKAKEQISFDDFKKTMEGIWSTSVLESTLDEAPMAYKSIDTIANAIYDVVDIADVIKPVYNFKAN